MCYVIHPWQVLSMGWRWLWDMLALMSMKGLKWDRGTFQSGCLILCNGMDLIVGSYDIVLIWGVTTLRLG